MAIEESLIEGSGLAHMDHNSLFVPAAATLQSAVDSMQNGLIEGSTGSTASTGGYGLALSTVPFDLTTDGFTEGREIPGDQSSVLDTINDSGGQPGIATAGTGVVMVGLTVEQTSSAQKVGEIRTKDGKIVGEIYRDPNICPNSRVERNAAHVYQVMHGGEKRNYTYPAVILDNPEGYDAVDKVFNRGTIGDVIDELLIWENVLSEYDNEQS